jgi:hypothetical protein
MVAALSVGTTLLQAALLVALLVGLRRRNVAIAANALVSLGATFLPRFVEFALYVTQDVAVSIDGFVPFWIAAAGVLHMAGMWGLYEHEATWWWDHVTHAVSAALVAAVAYGSLHGVVLATPGPTLPASSVAVVALLFTLLVGVLWELVELVVHRYSRQLGVESLLVPYGRRDAALDLAFDALGALVVVGFDVRFLGSVAAAAPALTGELLVAAGGLVVAGSLAAALVLLVGRRGSPDVTE